MRRHKVASWNTVCLNLIYCRDVVQIKLPGAAWGTYTLTVCSLCVCVAMAKRSSRSLSWSSVVKAPEPISCYHWAVELCVLLNKYISGATSRSRTASTWRSELHFASFVSHNVKLKCVNVYVLQCYTGETEHHLDIESRWWSNHFWSLLPSGAHLCSVFTAKSHSRRCLHTCRPRSLQGKAFTIFFKEKKIFAHWKSLKHYFIGTSSRKPTFLHF